MKKSIYNQSVRALSKNNTQIAKAEQSGRTMLEMLGVLAIMGLITYGAIAGINYGMNSYKINQMYTEVQDIIQGIEDLYSWNATYPDSSDQMMQAASENDIFSNPAVSACTGAGGKNCVKGSLGQITIDPIPPDYKNFNVIYFGIPADNCTRIYDMDWASFSVNVKLYAAGGAALSTCPETGTVSFHFSPK